MRLGISADPFSGAAVEKVERLHTEVGSQGISQTIVTIWKPGSDKRERINDTLSLLPALWKRSAL